MWTFLIMGALTAIFFLSLVAITLKGLHKEEMRKFLLHIIKTPIGGALTVTFLVFLVVITPKVIQESMWQIATRILLSFLTVLLSIQTAILYMMWRMYTNHSPIKDIMKVDTGHIFKVVGWMIIIALILLARVVWIAEK